MSMNFNVLSAQINSMTNDNETLFMSGKGDNAKLGSAGTLGRMFRSSSSFVEGAKAFLDGIAEKYGDGIRQMAWGMAVNSHDNGKFGLTVGMAKEIMAKCEMLAGMREELSGLSDPNSARVCARVLQDRLAEPGADVEKVMGEVRVLATMLKGANLSPEEGAALANALKGVTIPSKGAALMVILARQPQHPYRMRGHLPLLLGVCRQLFDCQTPLNNGPFDFSTDAENQSMYLIAQGFCRHEVRQCMNMLVDNIDKLAKLAKHGPPTRAMIARVVFTDPRLHQEEEMVSSIIAQKNLDKMNPKEFFSFISDNINFQCNTFWIEEEKSTLPLAKVNAGKLLNGTIFSFDKIYKRQKEDRTNFTQQVVWSLKFPELIAQFKPGNCPPITLENWNVDPAEEAVFGVFQNSSVGFSSKSGELKQVFYEAVGDLHRKNGEGNEISFSVSGQGPSSSVKIGSKKYEADIKAQFEDALSRCKSEKQKLLLGCVLTQCATKILKRIKDFFFLAKIENFPITMNEHTGCNVDVQFHKDGSVSVKYQFPKGLEAKYGKFDLAYSIDKNGNIKTEQFRYEIPDYVQNGQPPPANH